MKRELRRVTRENRNESTGGGAWAAVTGAGMFIAALIGGGTALHEHQVRERSSVNAEFERYCEDLTPSTAEFMHCPK